jgi:hypothetical protein
MMNFLKPLATACIRLILGPIFWIAVRITHDVEFHGVEHISGKRPIYVAMAHKRDVDPIIELPTILGHQGWRAYVGDVLFAMRGDFLSPGFLGRIVLRPRWFSWALSHLELEGILRIIGVRPLDSLQLRIAEEWVRDYLKMEGDLKAAALFTSAFLEQVAREAGIAKEEIYAAKLSDLLAWRYHDAMLNMCTTDIFVEERRLQARRILHKHVTQELSDLQKWFKAGGSIWGAPEGQLSAMGKLGPFTSALPRLLSCRTEKTYIIPTFIIYDFMTVKRLHIFVDVAPTIVYDPAQILQFQDIHAQLRSTWLANARFTCTQLGAGFLVKMSHAAVPTFTLDDLTRSLEQEAARLTTLGRHVDARLLYHNKARELANNFLQYAKLHGYVLQKEDGKYEATKQDLSMQVQPGTVGYDKYPLAYAWNELQEMLSINNRMTSADAVEQKVKTAV